jgi:hypothetical protein
VVGVSGCLANAVLSRLFYSYSAVMWIPIAFIRFYNACDRDRAVGPVRAAASTSFRRF